VNQLAKFVKQVVTPKDHCQSTGSSMDSKLAQVAKELMTKKNNQSKMSNDLEGSKLSKGGVGGGNSEKQPSNLSRS
jgi:hypothetical protein